MKKSPSSPYVAILGAGSIGQAIAKGLEASGACPPASIILSRRQSHLLKSFAQKGFQVQTDNKSAARSADIIIIAVLPQQLNALLREIAPVLAADKHIIISTVTGVSTDEILKHLGKKISVIRAMPNLACAITESMTCMASSNSSPKDLKKAQNIFDALGKTLIINEEDMVPATALCACGVAFFLRSIRAASQGGIEIGFHADDALIMAAQTAKGASALMLDLESHPESEIDKVTSPRGCTISGLNEMEHMGFSSAMIKGITTAAEKAAQLYQKNGK